MNVEASTSQKDENEVLSWQKTKSGKRILELKDVEENIARLLHFAGCTLASLHPEPISNFTSRDVPIPEIDSDDEDEGEDEDQENKEKRRRMKSVVDVQDKSAQFTKYAEAYYNTLNEVQISLRTSIRYLRLSRASPAPLLDPLFASLANLGDGAKVSAGGFSSGVNNEKPRMSVGALQLEKDALEDLLKALRKS